MVAIEPTHERGRATKAGERERERDRERERIKNRENVQGIPPLVIKIFTIFEA